MDTYENAEFIGDLDIGTENLELQISETQKEEKKDELEEVNIPFKVVRAFRYAVNRRGELEKRFVGQATTIPLSYIEEQEKGHEEQSSKSVAGEER